MLLIPRGHRLLMPWFNVDDSFYDHPKAWDAPDCAVALWTRAGSWSARSRKDGFVPAGMLARFCSDPEQAVRELLDRGLWERTKGGYKFHDWPDWNLTKVQIDGKREAGAERQRRHRARRGNGVTDADVTRDSRVSHRVQSNPIQSLVDVSNPATGSSGLVSQDVIEQIIKSIYEQTSRVVDDDWAAKIAGHILGDRSVHDPAGYCRKAIAKEPNPQARFLPVYPEMP
jgi:hypothetical protein